MELRRDESHLDRRKALDVVAAFYDGCRYGCLGTEGYRKSTDLSILLDCAEELTASGYISRERTTFLDLGCADGRVNVLMSYYVKRSLGIELDPEILAEYGPRRGALIDLLGGTGIAALPPDNVHVLAGSSLDASTHESMRLETGCGLADVDLFYTYITLHDVFGDLVGREARAGALYLVYGFSRVLPAYEGLDLLVPDIAGRHIAALYVKNGGIA